MTFTRVSGFILGNAKQGVADLSLSRYVMLLLIILACYGFCFGLHVLKERCVGPTSNRRVGTRSIKEREGSVVADSMI